MGSGTGYPLHDLRDFVLDLRISRDLSARSPSHMSAPLRVPYKTLNITYLHILERVLLGYAAQHILLARLLQFPR